MLLLKCRGRKEKFEEEAGKMDEIDDEEHSPLISVLPKLAGKSHN
jgi:hypothetical protein